MSRENRERHGRGTGLRRGAVLVGAALLLGATPALASEGGLVLTPTLPMLVGLIALFVALIFPLNALLFRPIFAALDAREEKIAGTRARADKLAADAQEVLERYQGSVREARETAEQERRSQLATAKSEAATQLAGARGDAEREIEQARGEIQGALATARASLRGEAEALAREASARILGRNLS